MQWRVWADCVIKSSGRLRRGSGARTHRRTRSQQLCLHRCLKLRTVAEHLQLCTEKHFTQHLVGIGAYFFFFSSLQLSRQQRATPAVSKTLTVITKLDAERCQLSSQAENGLKTLLLCPSSLTPPCRSGFPLCAPCFHTHCFVSWKLKSRGT